jgi:small subunit ribosomal protein S20
MANIASQIKRNRQNEKRRLRNKAARSEMKTRARRALEAAEAGNAVEARQLLRLAQSTIDGAVANKVMHRNTASRRMARLARRVEELVG